MSSSIESSRTRMQIAIPAVIALAAGVGLGRQMKAASVDTDESKATSAAAEIDRFYRAVSGEGLLDDILNGGIGVAIPPDNWRQGPHKKTGPALYAGPVSLSLMLVAPLQTTRAR